MSHEFRELERVVLQWLPLYAAALVSSPRYMAMLDYQQGWYLNLLIKSWLNSVNPGYLRNDDQLYMLANARTRSFWESQKSVVLACFQVSADGLWISNAKLLEVYEMQLKKLRQKKKVGNLSISVSDLGIDLEVDSKRKRTDEVTERILRRHPSNWHLKNKIHLPLVELHAVMQAILDSGPELVEQGTEVCACVAETLTVQERKFIPDPVKFYGAKAYYLKPREFWERDDERGQASKSEQRTYTRRRNIIDAFRGETGDDARRTSGERREGTEHQPDAGVQARVRKASAGSD